jgi:hypothetical protein
MHKDDKANKWDLFIAKINGHLREILAMIYMQ